MPINKSNYNASLSGISEDIDITPSKYRQAVERYKAVGSWLEDGDYGYYTGTPSIYPQGSFRLGTVVRPIRGGKESDYDIDLVCELPISKSSAEPKATKMMIGARLKDNGTYRPLLEDEGKRCWTLKYAEQDGIGFHMDVLPSVHDDSGYTKTAIAITDKQGFTYDWSASDPNGYAEWFEERNRPAFEQVAILQKALIREREPTLFAAVDDVPNQLVRTPLQRSIQIMKRHRDVMFDGRPYPPISMIITTLAGHLYNGEQDVYSALSNIVGQLDQHSVLMKSQSLANYSLAARGLIRRMSDGTWYIENPVNPKENFADRWHEDNSARAKAFFEWTVQIKEDLVDILTDGRPDPELTLSKSLGVPSSSSRLDFLRSSEHRTGPSIHIPSRSSKPWSH